MRKLSLLLVTALVVCVNALAASTTVVDTVYLASGAPAGGTISVLPNTQFVTNDGTYVALQAKVFTLATGKITMSLVPNLDAAPAYGNTYYRATYHLSDGSSYTETWVVPHSLVTLRIRDLMSNILSPGQAASVFLSPQQITQSGANNGDALVWNGAKNQYIPTPVGNTAVNAVTGIVKMDGTGGASAASLSDIEALGLGNIVTHNVNEFDIAGAAATTLASAQSSSLQKSANLSDVGSVPTTLSNLGIHSAAQHDAADFDSAGAAAAVQSAISGASLAKSANLSDIPSAPTARANLGLGDSATHGFSEFDRAGTATSAIAALNLGSAANHAASDFDPAGAANAAQTAAVTASDPAGAAAAAQAASDPNGAAASAVRGLNLKSAAQHDATDFDPAGAATTAQAAAQAASEPLGAAATAQSNAIAASDPRGAAAAAQSAAQAASDPLGTATSQIAALSLGTAAQHPASDFDPAGAAAAVQSAAQAASDPAGTAAAQIAALNLKSASQHAVSDFDAAGAADTAQANAIAASDARGAATAAQAAAITASLQKAANLADLANLATARTNLGLGDAAIHNAADFDAAGAASTAQSAAQASSLQKSANLSDVANAGTSRANLGLGTVATHNVQEFDMAGAAAAASVIAQSTSLQDANNLSDLSSPAAARGHLGLGDIATHGVADFDATGSAAAAQVAAQGSSLQKSANLSDLNSALTSRTNLGLGSSATHPATDFEPIGAAAAATAAAQASSAQKAANLGDLPSPSTARTNLGLPADSTLDFANAANITTGTLPAGRLPASAVQTTTDSTYGAVTVDASGTAHSLPTKTGLTANKPATCKIGEMYFATDAQPGLNFLYCGATNVWTSQTAAIAGSGTGLVPSNNLSDLTSVATARNNLQLGTSALQPSTAFLGTANNLSDIPNPALARTNLGLPSTFIDTTNAANITSGTMPAGRLPALVGDVTLPVGTNTTTVAAVGGQSATNVANASAAWAAANTANNPLKLDINGFTPAAQAGALSGDVTKPAGSASTTVANVGGQSATNVAQVSSAWQTPNTANSPLKLDINGRIPYAQLPAITGDVTSIAGGGTTTIQLVGGQSAANVAAASTAWQGRNTANGPLQLDAGGHVAAAQGETLTGDVTKTAGVSTTTVSSVGGQSASNVAAVSSSFQNANTANSIIKGDASALVPQAQIPSLTGDVTKTAGVSTTTVATVGGQSAANIAAVSSSFQNSNTANNIVKTDGSALVLQSQIPSLTGDVSKNAANSATTVSTVGGQLAANIAKASIASNASVNAATFAGVDPTGTTSSTSGLQNAVTTAGTGLLTIPKGTYRACGVALQSLTKIAGNGSTLTFDPAGCPLTTVALTAQGSGYTTATVSIGAPPAGGTQATATATVAGGKITSITLTPGSGYISAPSVSISGDGTGAQATAYVAIVNAMAGAALQTSDKMILRDLTIDCGNAAGVSGIVFGNNANVATNSLSVSHCPATGMYLHDTQFAAVLNAKLYANGTGLKIDSDPVAGGGNSNSFYDLQAVGNNVGVYINALFSSGIGGLYFRNPTVNVNVVGLASYNAQVFPTQFIWDGGNPEANATSGMSASVTVDGLTFPRSVLWLDHTTGTLDNVADEDTSPLYIQTNSSTLQMVNNFLSGGVNGQIIQSDATSTVNFAGAPVVGGVTNNATNFPATLNGGRAFTVIGPAIAKTDPIIPNAYPGNPYTPAVSQSFSIGGSAVTADAQMGQVQSVTFAPTVGAVQTNSVRFNTAAFTTTEDTLASVLIKSSVTGSFAFGFYGHEGTPVTLQAGKWVRVLVANSALSSSTFGFVDLFPNDANGATVSITRLQVLQIASGDPTIPGYFSAMSGTGAFNPNGTLRDYASAIFPGSVIVSTGGSVDLRSALTSPFQTGLNASKPASCAVGQMYFSTDATPGQNIYGCTSTNTWTLNSGAGGSGGGLTAPGSNGIMKYTGSNTTAAAVLSDVTALTGTGTTAASNLGLATVAGSGVSTALTDSAALLRNNAAVTTSSTVDFGTATGTRPVKTGLNASKPGTCTVGQLYFSTDSPAGQNLYGCSSTNTWTLSSGGGTGGGITAPASNGLMKYVGGNATAAATLSDITALTGTGATAASNLGVGNPAWSALSNPAANQALDMQAFTSQLTYNSATGANDLWKMTDTTSNNGTGVMAHITTASGSSETPWQADAAGIGWQVNNAGQLASTGNTGSGTITLSGSTSGNFTQTVPAAAGTWQFSWPAAPAQAHQWMTTDVNGVATFTQPSYADIAGSIPVSEFNAGTNASATTFWRGDGVWAAPPASGGGATVPSGTSGYLFTNGSGTITSVSTPSGTVPATSTLGDGFQNNGTSLVVTNGVVEAAAAGIVCDGSTDNTTNANSTNLSNHTIHLPDFKTCLMGNSFAPASNTKWMCKGCTIGAKGTFPGSNLMSIISKNHIEFQGVAFDDEGVFRQSFKGSSPSTASTSLLTVSGGSGWQPNFKVGWTSSGGGCASPARGYFTTNSSGVPNGDVMYDSGYGCTSTPVINPDTYCGDGFTGCVAPTFTWQSGLTAITQTNNNFMVDVEQSTDINFKGCFWRSTGATLANMAGNEAALTLKHTSAIVDDPTFEATLTGAHVIVDSTGDESRRVLVRNITSYSSLINGIQLLGYPGGTEIAGGHIYNTGDAWIGLGQQGNGISIYNSSDNYVHGVTITDPYFSGVRVTGPSNVNSATDARNNRVEDVVIEGNLEVGVWAELGAEHNYFKNITVRPSTDQPSATCFDDTNGSDRPHYGLNYFSDMHCIGQISAGAVIEHAKLSGLSAIDVAIPVRLGFGGTGGGNTVTGVECTNTGAGYSTSNVCFGIDRFQAALSKTTGVSTVANNAPVDYPFGATPMQPIAYMQFDAFPLINGIDATSPAVIHNYTNAQWPNSVGSTYMITGVYGMLNAAGQSLNGQLCGVTAVTATTITCGGVTGVPALSAVGYNATPFQLAPTGRGQGMLLWLYKNGNTTASWSPNANYHVANAFLQ